MSHSKKVAWIVWLVASIFYAYQYILRVMPNIILGDIMQKFDMDAAVLGQFSGVYYIGYALIHIPIGLLLDRYGPKRVMTICILLTVAGMLPLVLAQQGIYPILGRILVGIGSSAAILGTFKIIHLMFSEKLFPRLLSFAVTIGLIGAIYGGAPVNYLLDTLGYNAVIQIFCAIGLLLAISTYFIVPDMEPEETQGIFANVKAVLGNTKVVALCLSAGLMVGPLEGFADVWGVEFLKQVYGYEAILAAKLTSMIFIGMCFGAPLLSFIADKAGSYLGTIIGAGLLMAIAFIVLLSGFFTPFTMGASFIVVGVGCAYQILAIYKASTYVEEQVVGLTTAVANMIIMSFGYVFHTFIGLIVNTMGGPGVSKAFVYGIALIPIGLCIGSAGFITLARLQTSK